MANPLKPQYGGGIVANPELDHGLKGWTGFGDAHLEQKVSEGGNNFIAAKNRHGPRDSFSQKFKLEKGKFYTFSGTLFCKKKLRRTNTYIKQYWNIFRKMIIPKLC